MRNPDEMEAVGKVEQGYNPGPDPAEVDTSYYHPMVSDVLAMVKDCPGSDAVTRKIIGG